MQSRDRKTASQLISRISILSTRMFEVLTPGLQHPLNPRGIYEISIHEKSGYIPLTTTSTTKESEGVQNTLFGRFVRAMLEKKERGTTDTTETSMRFHTFPQELALRIPRIKERSQIVSLRFRLVTSQYSATRPFSITATLSYNALVGQTCTGMASITSPGSKRLASVVTRPMCSSL